MGIVSTMKCLIVVLLTLLVIGGNAQEEEGSGVEEEIVENEEDIVTTTDINDEDAVTTTEFVDEGGEDAVTTTEFADEGDEDAVTTTEFIDEGSGELGSGDDDIEDDFVVTNSATYNMASTDGKTTVSIVIQAVSSSDLLNMVCDFSSSDETVFAEKSCFPSIYLVAGHTSCASLPAEVSAKKLADVHEAGLGEVLVDATWSELPGKCLLIVRKAGCGSDGDDGSGEVIDVGEEENDSTTDASEQITTTETIVEESEFSMDTISEESDLEASDIIEESGDLDDDDSVDDIESMDNLRTSKKYSTLRSAGFGRSYGTISLSGFTLLSSGSTSAFTVSIPTVNIVSVPAFNGLTTTTYNKYATLPLLQLTGWTYADAVNIGIVMVLLYFAIFQTPIISLEPIKRRILSYSESDDFAARIDGLQHGLWDITRNTVENVAGPWIDVVRHFGRNLLRRKSSKYYPRSGSNEVYYQDQNEYSPYSPYLDHKNGWVEYTDQNEWEGYQNLVY